MGARTWPQPRWVERQFAREPRVARRLATSGLEDTIPLEGVTKSKTRNAKNWAILQIFKEVVLGFLQI